MIFDLDLLADLPPGYYLVGGTVRDFLMGQTPADIDLVVSGDLAQAAARVAEKTGGRIVDLGKQDFAVLRVAASPLTIDITPLADGSIESDLRRRDFTINAIAYDIAARRLVDCTDGLSDLKKKTVRMVSTSVFAEDPARLVRAYRMAATFRFSIAADTRMAIGRDSHLVDRVAGERIWAELKKLFAARESVAVLRQMATDGLLTAILPELLATIGCTQNRHHQFDVFSHSLRAYAALETLLASAGERFAGLAPAADLAALGQLAPVLKYAVLLHDAGKPETRRVDADGRVRFPGHAARSAAITDRVSRRLRLSRQQREWAEAIVRHHIRPLFLFLARQKGTLGRRGLVRFFTHCGDLTLPIILHTMADIMAKQETPPPRDASFIAFCDRLMADFSDYRERSRATPPLIGGKDLIQRFHLTPSPRFKEILRQVEERRLTGELRSRKQALAWVAKYLKQGT